MDALLAAGQSGKNTRTPVISPLIPVPGTPPAPGSPGVRSPTAAAQILYTITPVIQ